MQTVPTIRAYLASDHDAALAIFDAAVRASRDYDAAQIAAWARVDRAQWIARRNDRKAWIAEVNGVAAGFADLEPDGHVDRLFVDPAMQRRGVAHALLGEIEAAARAQGNVRLFTEASIAARGFFAAHGFALIAAQTVALRGQRFRNFRMEKPLG